MASDLRSGVPLHDEKEHAILEREFFNIEVDSCRRLLGRTRIGESHDEQQHDDCAKD
jgi:hypothetical protein